MGTQISNVIDVQITKEASRLSRAGFGVPILINDNYKQYERAVLYDDPADMLTINGGPYSTTDDLYVAALNLMGQSLSPTQFYIGRKYATVNSLATITFSAAATGGSFTLDISIGGAAAVTTGAIAQGTLPAAIEVIIEAVAGITSCTVTMLGTALVAGDADGFTVEFDGADAGLDRRITAVNNSLTPANTATLVMTQYGSTLEDWATCYNAVVAANNLWYEFIPIERVITATEAEFTALAAVVETQMKTLSLTSLDPVILTTATTDIASDLSALNYARSCTTFSSDTASWVNAAWAGRCLPENPGSITWNWKELAGVVVDDFTAAEIVNMKAKNCNFFEDVGNYNVISSGSVMASGEYRDIIRGIDLLTARMSEDLFDVLVNAKKIPQTDIGGAQVEGTLRGSLLRYGVGYSIITEDSIVVTVPKVSTIPSSEKEARWLNNVTWSATLVGAWHTITIRGKVVV